MEQYINRFDTLIVKLRERTVEEGISSNLQDCKYSHIKGLQGRRLKEVPVEILAECNFKEYKMARFWNQAEKHNLLRGVGDCVLEFLMTPIRYATFRYYHSKALKSF